MGQHLNEIIIQDVIDKIALFMDTHKTYRQVSELTGIEENLLIRVIKNQHLESRFATGNEARLINTKDTHIKKYGSLENYSKHQKEATTKGMLDKYGVTHNSKLKETIEKRKKTIQNKSEEEKSQILEKRNHTIEEKFGSVDNFWKHQQSQSKKTKLYKYGNETFTNPDKIKQTIKERYGVDNVFYLENIKQKIKETCLDKYGVENYSRSNEYKRKVQNTNLKKYGTKIYFHSKDYKQKTQETNLKKYGVTWYVLTQDCIDKRKIKKDSKPNKEFEEKLLYNNQTYEKEFKLDKYIFDFKLNNTLIEINPFPTHNIDWGLFNNPITKDYHKNKTLSANKKGYNVMHVWDWDDKDKIISILKSDKIKIGSRSCVIKEIPNKIANEFLDKNHLQNSCRGNKLNIALIYNGIIVSIMTFGNPRYNKKYEWELLRFCNNLSYLVFGSASKLFNYFVVNYHPKSIISYCDRSKFTGNIYKKLGFTLIRTSNPAIHWTNGKQHITDNLLRQRGFDQLFGTNYGKGTSNEELMLKTGFVRVPDCGQETYIIKFNLGEE